MAYKARLKTATKITEGWSVDVVYINTVDSTDKIRRTHILETGTAEEIQSIARRVVKRLDKRLQAEEIIGVPVEGLIDLTPPVEAPEPEAVKFGKLYQEMKQKEIAVALNLPDDPIVDVDNPPPTHIERLTTLKNRLRRLYVPEFETMLY